MYYGYNISEKVAAMAVQAEADCKEIFAKIDENVLICSAKVLNAFQECKVSTADFIEVAVNSDRPLHSEFHRVRLTTTDNNVCFGIIDEQ